jgi:hypothetical protein
MDLPKLSRGEEPMLIEGIEDLAGHRAKPRDRLSRLRLKLRAVHRLVFGVEKVSARADRPECRKPCGRPG